RELGRWIGGRVEVRAIRRLDASFEGKRPPASRRPRVAKSVAAAVPVRGTRDAEGVPDDHGAPRHCGLPDGRHRAHALLDRARLLRFEADPETGTVHQVDDGQMERLREVDPALDLLAGVGGPGAAVMERVAGHRRDRPAVETRQPRDTGTPGGFPNL